jgi:hypothetical protein
MESLSMVNNNNNRIDAGDQFGINGDMLYRANFISRLFFIWSLKLIKLANFTTLKKEHIGNAEGSHKSKFFMNKLYYIWNELGYRNRGKYKLLLTTLRANLGNLTLTIRLYRSYHILQPSGNSD